MEEPRKFKKYIYISKEVKPAIEDYCTKNNITLVTRFINEYNLGKFMHTELRNLNSVNYLILDLSAFTQLTGVLGQVATTIYNIINTRLNRGKPTIISTNLDFKKIAERYDDRVASRLNTMYTCLEFHGDDVRLQQKKQNTIIKRGV